MSSSSRLSRDRARRRRHATAVMAIAALLAGVIGVLVISRSPSFAATPSTMLNINCSSPSLGGTLPAAVYLPAGYQSGSARFPVIYFLHGLPASTTAYRSTSFVAVSVAAGGYRAIVVAPQGSRSDNSDREYLNWGPRENWPAAITHDLTRCIDKRFRTIPGRRGRALIGLSAGGFGAFNVGLRNVQTFAAVESWSGYFAATDPAGLHVLDLGSDQANEEARVPPDARLDSDLERHPTFVGFYVGQQDSRFLGANILLDRAFTQDHIPHLFRVYPGGHSGSLWSSHGALWIGLALKHLARAH